MELPDITQLTEQQWDQLVAAIQQAKEVKRIERELEQAALKKEVSNSPAALDALIGPDTGATPGFGSIAALKAFTDQQIQGNLVLAVRKLLDNEDKIARILRDVAKTQ